MSWYKIKRAFYLGLFVGTFLACVIAIAILKTV